MAKASSLLLYHSCLACLCHLLLLLHHHHRALGFSTPVALILPGIVPISKTSSTILSSLRFSKLPTTTPTTAIPYYFATTTTNSTSSSNRTPTTKSDTIHSIEERNGLDSDYPWRFEGRFLFRPSLVRIADNCAQPPPPKSTTLLSLFGYSLGGTVVLEYDISPVGPYREYVTMGGVVGFGSVNVGNDDVTEERTLGIGQWGTNLYVSTRVAEDVCHNVWGVPAQLASIEFVETGSTLDDYEPSPLEDGNGEGMRKFCLSGWGNTRLLNQNNATTEKRYGYLPMYWTPTIKALWAPLLFPGRGVSDKSVGRQKHLLPLHKLRLSASAIRLKRCRRRMSANQVAGEIPLGFALVVDDVMIEIGERVASSTYLDRNYDFYCRLHNL